MSTFASESAHVVVPTTWIYFLAVGRSIIKIGKSRQPRGDRLTQHLKPSLDGHTPTVSQLVEVRGCDADEKALHRHFTNSRAGVGVESFRATKEIVDYLRWLRDQPFVCVPEMTDDERGALPLVEADAWMPRPERFKPRDDGALRGLYLHDLYPRVLTIDDFYTGQIIIEAARVAMDGIDLDPASHAVANTVVRARTFYTAGTNGLAHAWAGNVWCNPPFSDWANWAAKIVAEKRAGRVDQACVLAATRTITAKYFRDLKESADAVCILDGRIPFWGKRAKSPNDGHAIFYLGSRTREFADAFKDIGTVYFSSKASP